MSGDLWCLMRAAELERARQRRCHPDAELDAELQQCEQGHEDPDSMEDEHKPYFWNRRS